MKLIKAKVANFGNLKDFEFDFNDGVNSFIYENGWGKTTFAVFIKAMFFGMEQTTRRLENNEKRKYTPWQGGIYGGRLSFEYKEQKYEISRSFGTKADEDYFELIDLQTNKVSNDFGEDLGEKIFGVNKDTFEKSIYIVLDTTPEGSADISAKLNSLVEADDIGNFDNAKKKLEENIVSIKKRRGSGGILFDIQNKIDQRNQELSDIERKEVQNTNFKKNIAEENNKFVKLKEEENKLKNQLVLSADYEKKQRYAEALKNKKGLEDRKNKIISFFNDKIPNKETLDNIDGILKDFNTNETNLKNDILNQTEKDTYEDLRSFFAGDIPNDDAISRAINTHSKYNAFRQKSGEIKLSPDELEKYKVLKKKYLNKDVSNIDNYIQAISGVQIKKDLAKNISDEVKKLDISIKDVSKESGKKIISIAFSVLGLVSLIGSGILFFILNSATLFGFIFFGISFVLFATSFFIKPKKSNKIELEKKLKEKELELNNLTKEIENITKEITSFVHSFLPGEEINTKSLLEINDEYRVYKDFFEKDTKYQNWLHTVGFKPEDLENELKNFLNRYCKKSDINLFDAEVQTLNEKIKQLDSLKTKIDRHSKIKENYKQLKGSLERILSQYKTEKTNSFNEQVQEIRQNYNDLNSINTDKSKIEKNLKEFETENKEIVDNFENIQAPDKAVKEIEHDLQSKGEDIKKVQFEITRYQNLIAENSLAIDKKGDIENEIDNLLIRKKENENHYDDLTKAKNFLEKAKENLDKKYSDPIKEGFKKYISILGASIPLEIDTDLKIHIKGEVKNYEANYLSAGYKDLVNFCARMALVDALYKDLNPCLILDDPFVNLDDDKVEFAIKLIQEIGKERQLIYFACHNSRAIR